MKTKTFKKSAPPSTKCQLCNGTGGKWFGSCDGEGIGFYVCDKCQGNKDITWVLDADKRAHAKFGGSDFSLCGVYLSLKNLAYGMNELEKCCMLCLKLKDVLEYVEASMENSTHGMRIKELILGTRK